MTFIQAILAAIGLRCGCSALGSTARDSELFGWEFGDPVGPTSYAVVQRDGNTNADGVGIGSGIGSGIEIALFSDPEGHVIGLVK
jgi:hypothetical protein